MQQMRQKDEKVIEKPYFREQYERWVEFVAIGGLYVRDGEIVKQTITAFAKEIGVERSTLNRWKKTPGFWDLVNDKRGEAFKTDRLTAVWNGLFLQAAKGKHEQAKIILGHFANWQPPSQKHEVKVGGLGDLVNLARNKRIIEGEVSSGTDESVAGSVGSGSTPIPAPSTDYLGDVI
jgi:hypothetical protein